MSTSTHCPCFESMPEGSLTSIIGVDTTCGRYGDVTVSTCCLCGRRWLCYFAEYEGFTASQRRIRGILPESVGLPFPPGEAIPIFNSLPWYFFHGSAFPPAGTVHCARGDAPADLGSLGGERLE